MVMKAEEGGALPQGGLCLSAPEHSMAVSQQHGCFSRWRSLRFESNFHFEGGDFISSSLQLI